MKNIKLANRISIIVISLLTVCFLILWKSMDGRISSSMKEQILGEMYDSVETRSEIIEQYVQAAESYLVGYGQAPELKETLLDPDNSKAVEAAQEYTDSYALVNDNLENIYLADYNSTVLLSYVKAPIGKTLREGEALEQLRNEVFDSREIWNTGIMASPSTGKQVVSLYYPVYSGSEPLGYVGGAIYAEELKNILDVLAGDGRSQANYILLDAAKNTFIFCGDESQAGTVVDNKNLLSVIEAAKLSQAGDSFREYEEDGKEMLAVYRYLPDRDWVLVIVTDEKTAFAPVSRMSVMLFLMCAVILVVISVCVWAAGKLIARDIISISNIIHEIGTLDLTLKDKLKQYASRKDEAGMIAKSTFHLVEAISDAVTQIKGNNAELLDTSNTLSSRVTVANGSVDNVEKAMHEIADNATQQAADTEQATESVLHIGETIEKTMSETEALTGYASNIQQNSEKLCSTVKKLSKVNVDTEAAMEEINTHILSTNDSAVKIKEAAQLITDIAGKTNLLSLNASIEAARAGEQGRGFAIVARQIQELAEQSNDSAKLIGDIINELIRASDQAVDSMVETKEILAEQSRQLSYTEDQFSEIHQNIEVTKQSVTTIYDSIKNMDEERITVVDIVQNLSGIAQDNVASTQETLASTGLVKDMVKDIADGSDKLIVVSHDMEESISGFTI